MLDLRLMSGNEVVRDSKNKIDVTERGADHSLTNSHRECESKVPGERYITLEDIFYSSCKGIPPESNSRSRDVWILTIGTNKM